MATPFTFTIEHRLGKAEAKRRIAERFSEIAQAAPGFTFAAGAHAWDGDVFPLAATGYGQTVRGAIEAFDAAVRVTVDIPDMLAPLANGAMALLRARTRLLLLEKK
jgi:hypothetical protein